MKVGVNWQRQMQMVAFMLITVICFFMPIRTRPEWAGGQPEAGSALITVRRSFIWRTFIYSFNFLSFMCSTHTPLWHGCMLSGMHYTFFDRQMSSRFSLHVRFEWEIVLFIFWYEWQDRNDFCLSDLDKYPSVFQTFSYACFLGCRHIWCCPGHVVAACFSA